MNQHDQATEKSRVLSRGPMFLRLSGLGKITFTMHPEPPPLGTVFTTALMMALDAGAREISIEILLAALDHPFSSIAGADAFAGPLLSVPHKDLPLSADAASAISPFFVGLPDIPLNLIRSALIATANITH